MSDSSFKIMRILVIFDLPVDTKQNRKAAHQFREFLLDDGYDMLQFSVYTRFCRNIQDKDKHIVRLKRNMPKEGNVRAILITEHQYETMHVFLGEKNIAETALTSDNLVEIE